MSGEDEIAGSGERRSVITSHSIGVPELAMLFASVPADAPADAYRQAAVVDNVLGFGTDKGRLKRFKTLRTLYQFDPQSVLFRALRDLWPDDPDARPLLAGLCALARDTVFRSTAGQVLTTSPGVEVEGEALVACVKGAFPEVYADSTLQNIGWMAHKSWGETGHLEVGDGRRRFRTRAVCRPANVAYAFLLGHLAGARGEGLYETVYARALDVPAAHLPDLAFQASQRGMLEFRAAGGVTEVGFRELLRPLPEDQDVAPTVNGQPSLLEDGP